MTSPPSTPSSSLPENEGQWRFHNIDTPTEWVESYRPGRLHPVHLGDEFRDGRYKVVRKLGDGAFSTVWLALEKQTHRYVALKILEARASRSELLLLQTLATPTCSRRGRDHVTEFLGSFEHNGPNGTHLCLVLEAMGPSAASMVYEIPGMKRRTSRYPKWMAKEMLRQCLLGLDYLHQNGITHGDLQPGNMLFGLEDLSKVPENSLSQPDHGEAYVSSPVKRIDGKEDKWAPRYLAIAQPLTQFTPIEPGFKIKLSDLGASFYTDKPAAEIVTPVGLRAPELLFGGQVSEAIDIWSFGCLVFEFLTRRTLFAVLTFGMEESETDDDHILQMMAVLGKLPSELLNKWQRKNRYLDPDGKLINSNVGDDWQEEPFVLDTQTLEELFAAKKPIDMGEDETAQVISLMRSILQYDYKNRPSAAELLQHPWFAAERLNGGKE